MNDDLDDLVQRLHRRGVSITLDGDRLRVQPWPKVRDAERELLRQHRDDLVVMLTEPADTPPEGAADAGEPQQPAAPAAMPALSILDAAEPEREPVAWRIIDDPILGRVVTPIYEHEQPRRPRRRVLINNDLFVNPAGSAVLAECRAIGRRAHQRVVDHIRRIRCS